MDIIRPIVRLSGFTAEQFAVLVPIIMGSAVLLLAALQFGVAYMDGFSMAEFAPGFLLNAAIPAAGATVQLGMVGLSFAVAACFGVWCLSQATRRPDRPLLSRLPRSVSTVLISDLPLNSLRHILPTAFAGGLSLHARNRAFASTPADLSGAAPLLN